MDGPRGRPKNAKRKAKRRQHRAQQVVESQADVDRHFSGFTQCIESDGGDNPAHRDMLVQQNVVIDEDGWPAVEEDPPPKTEDPAACSHDGASVITASVDETAKMR